MQMQFWDDDREARQEWHDAARDAMHEDVSTLSVETLLALLKDCVIEPFPTADDPKDDIVSLVMSEADEDEVRAALTEAGIRGYDPADRYGFDHCAD